MTDVELQKKLVEIIHEYMIDAGFKSTKYEIKTYDKRLYGELFGLTLDGVKFIETDLKKSSYKNKLDVVRHMYEPHKYSLIFTYYEE